MTQRDRDRLVVLKKAQEKLITQTQAAAELELTPRHVRRLVKRLDADGDAAIVHGLRGKPSNRKLSEATRQKIVAILSQPDWKGLGPTLASYHLAEDHKITIGREALRQIMISAGLWRANPQKVEQVHMWRPRRSCRGELVQWDTSEHDWLEGRGEKMYLISMIDDATSELMARFVPHDSTRENMQLLGTYVEKNGRPIAFYTDKASLFQTAPKVARDKQALPREEPRQMRPTQIARALQELQIAWIPAHGPQAKGRVERSFAAAQDRLVKGMRLAGVCTLEDANRYLEDRFIPWWNTNLTLVPASAADAHRPLGPEHDLGSALSHVETRLVTPNYTFRSDSKTWQIARKCIRPGMRGDQVRVELRLDGSMVVRYRDAWLEISECKEQPKKGKTKASEPVAVQAQPRDKPAVKPGAAWRASHADLCKGGSNVYAAAAADRTRTRDRFD